MLFKQSPHHYWANYINPNRPVKESTKAMDFGSAFHKYTLESETFYDEYVIECELEPVPKVGLLRDLGRPEFERQKTQRAAIEVLNDATKEEFQSRAAGKIILDRKDFELLMEMNASIYKNEQARDLIQDATIEQSYFWQDKDSGLWVKARPDIIHDNMIVDLKTCVSASTRAYQRAMIDGGYHLQAAIIREAVNVLEGRDTPNAINICIEKNYPYCIGIKVISEEALEAGRTEFKAVLMQMAECFKTNEWPSYTIESVDIPSWYNV
jgi:hypothetical protein